MNKIIKIILLTLLISLISFVLVISVSNAVDHSKPTYPVSSSTSAKDMIKALLKDGKNLTGINVSVLNTNPYIYCRQRGTSLWSGTAAYQLASGTNPIQYPGNDSNGHAKAYILSADGYVKNDGSYGVTTAADERQYAWWFSINQGNGGTANDLYNIAMEYQNYKKSEQSVKVIPENGNIEGEIDSASGKYVAGPVKVQYSYKKATSGSKSDEWGGFSYAILDSKNVNINNKVQLCTKSGNTYTQINSTKNGDYYKVTETTYNNKDLYIVTSDKTLGEIKLKIKTSKIDYIAEVYNIEGTAKMTTSRQVRCDACDVKMSSARTSIGAAIEDIEVGKASKAYYTSENMLYIVTKSTSVSDAANHVYIKDNTRCNLNNEAVGYAPTYSTLYKCSCRC